jgi:hypothetical protein
MTFGDPDMQARKETQLPAPWSVSSDLNMKAHYVREVDELIDCC